MGCERVSGISIFNKKVILYGSEGNVKMFTSESCRDEADLQGNKVLPKATVQVAQPVALSAKLCEHCRCGCEPCCVIPDCIASRYGGAFETKKNMKKEFRIKKTQEFAEILNYKKFYTCPSFAIYVKPKKEEHARVGISVGKKLGKAVQRNKIKRQVRMMVQEIYDFSENFDTIILVRVKYKEESYLNNKKLLERLVKKVKI